MRSPTPKPEGVIASQRRIEEQVNSALERLAPKPTDLENRQILAELCLSADLFGKAEEILRPVVEAGLAGARIFFDYGIASEGIGQKEKAQKAYESALALDPRLAGAHFRKGRLHHARGELDEALAGYDRALALEPLHTKARFNRGLIQLLRGELKEGLRDYESRLTDLNRPKPGASDPLVWKGDFDIVSKTILLRSEQGLGDTLFWARFVPELKKRGAHAILEVQQPLVRLLAADSEATVCAKGETLPHYDAECMLGSLPFALGIETPPTLPENGAYLKPDPSEKMRWEKILGTRKGLRVGIAWSGNPDFQDNDRRAVPYSLVRPLFDLPGIHFVNLQVALTPDEEEDLRKLNTVSNPTPMLSDFADTAGLVSDLDLVLTADTSVAHLAGALGKELWLVLANLPDWRWGLNSPTCAWYPSAKLFRQPRFGDWESIFAEVTTRLMELAGSHAK